MPNQTTFDLTSRATATTSQYSPAVGRLSRRSRTRAAFTSHTSSGSDWCGTRTARHRFAHAP